MKNLSELHVSEKEVSAIPIFKSEMGTVTSIQLNANGTLKEHVSKTPALLLCINGFVTYGDEYQQRIELKNGDFIHIKAQVRHELFASIKSQLILLK